MNRILTLALVLGCSGRAHATGIQTMPLIDLGQPEAVAAWRPVHDGVMGGVSRGSVRAADGTARFEGEVSLENNGGFASFRLSARLPDLTDQQGLSLRVRGDGQVYKLSLRTDGAWDGVSWQAPFATERGRWQTVELAFEDLVPTWRGRLVREAGPFDPARIRQLGLLIADKQAGPFLLELAGIDAWRDTRATAGSRASQALRSAELAAAVDAGADADDLAADLRWRERLVVVAAPGELEARASVQVGRLLGAGPELAARELRVLQLMGSRGGRLAGRTLDAAQVRELRARWELPADDWQVALVGKDGGVKARWSAPVGPDAIFELIDAMPMRRDEVDRRRERD